MKIRNFLLVAMLLAPTGLQAASVFPNPTPITATSLSPTGSPDVLGIVVGLNNTGTAAAGDWSATATGGAEIKVTNILTTVIGSFSSRTFVDANSINFQTTASGVVLAAVPTGLLPKWSASVSLASLNLSPNTNYELTFNLNLAPSILALLSPSTATALFNSFNVGVGNSGNDHIFAQILGITDIIQANGSFKVPFKTGALNQLPVIATFSGSALLNTDLVLAGILSSSISTVYRVSDINVNATEAVAPEPGSWVIPTLLGGLLIFRRKRCR